MKPLIQSGKIEEQYEKLQETVAALKESLVQQEEMKQQIAENAERVQKEISELLTQLEATRGSNTVIF